MGSAKGSWQGGAGMPPQAARALSSSSAARDDAAAPAAALGGSPIRGVCSSPPAASLDSSRASGAASESAAATSASTLPLPLPLPPPTTVRGEPIGGDLDERQRGGDQQQRDQRPRGSAAVATDAAAAAAWPVPADTAAHRALVPTQHPPSAAASPSPSPSRSSGAMMQLAVAPPPPMPPMPPCIGGGSGALVPAMPAALELLLSPLLPSADEAKVLERLSALRAALEEQFALAAHWQQQVRILVVWAGLEIIRCMACPWVGSNHTVSTTA